jgi:peptide/nickel transport system permease protein
VDPASWWSKAWADTSARIGLSLIAFLLLVALLAPLLSAYDPTKMGIPVVSRFLPPSARHLMGTDLLGRDLYSRVVYGARISLFIGVASVSTSVLLGILVGAAAGFLGGFADSLLMRFTDFMLAFPRLFLILALMAVFSPSTWLVVLVLGTTGWMGVARVVRGGVLQVRGMDFVEAGRALGIPRARLLLRHVLPSAMAPVIVAATLRVGNAILAESFLSFLGLGVQPPAVSWGQLIGQGRDTLLTAWWISTFPGLAITLTVIGFNLLGDGLRDLNDPRLIVKTSSRP